MKVQHFGSEGGKYTVSSKIKDTTDGSSIVEESGSYDSEKDETYGYYGFDVHVRFDRPVRLEKTKEYQLVSQINGPVSWYGEDGQRSVECRGVRFTFRSSGESSGRTSKAKGQFPAFLVS